MNHSPRRVAIEALVRINATDAYANLALQRLIGDAGLNARDRRFVTMLVYGTIRMGRALDHVLNRFLHRDPPPVARAALRMGAHQILHLGTPPHAAVAATVQATPTHYRGLVNAILRKVAVAESEGITYPTVAVELSYPDWIVERLETDLGTQRARAALETMNRPAQVHRRDDGYVQDLSASQVAQAVPVLPGDRVLDLCAAPGGKATALAGYGAWVVAGDRHRGRAGLIVANRDHLALDNVHVVVGDAAVPAFASDSFEAVLVDAPCSGLGVLRRRPDARWRITEADIAELARLQHRILAAASSIVRPGGYLVYSVCTLTRAEAVDPVSAVHSDFVALGPPDSSWQHLDGPSYLLAPDDDHDGVAIARWQRRR